MRFIAIFKQNQECFLQKIVFLHSQQEVLDDIENVNKYIE